LLKINEIKLGMSAVSTEGKVVAKSEPRSVRTRFGSRSVADAELEDETGTIKLSLWEQQIDPGRYWQYSEDRWSLCH